MKYANILSFVCIGILLGVLLNSFLFIDFIGVLFILTLSIIIGVLFFKNSKCINLAFFLIAFCVGIFIYHNAYSHILEKTFMVPKEKINLVGTIDNVDKRDNGKIFLIINQTDKLKYPVRITLYNEYRDFQVNQKVNLYGKLEIPTSFNGFDYRGYLAKEKIAYIMTSSYVQVISQEKSLKRNIFNFKQTLLDGLYAMLPPDKSALYSAMLFGGRNLIHEDLQQNLRDSGIAHIVAISGLHIAILSGVIFFLLSLLPIHKNIAWITTLLIIGLYVFMIEAPSSAVRASFIVFAVFIANLFGRPNAPARTLLLIATIMVLLNPLIMRYDVGFQLSFVAVASILLALKYTNKKYLQNSFIDKIKIFLIISTTVYLGTLPLIYIHFKNLAELGILANILIIPLLPLVLVVGLITTIFGVIGLPSILSAGAYALSWYIIKISELFSY